MWVSSGTGTIRRARLEDRGQRRQRGGWLAHGEAVGGAGGCARLGCGWRWCSMRRLRGSRGRVRGFRWWRRLRREVSEEPIERALVRVVVLPPGEVADMAPLPYVRRPSNWRFHYRVVEPNRKEHRSVLPPLPLPSHFHLSFDPIAFNGILRDNQHEFVMNPDRFVDPGTDLVADLEVLLIEPCADTTCLEVCMETFGEVSVFGTVADEARVELNRLHRVQNQRQ